MKQKVFLLFGLIGFSVFNIANGNPEPRARASARASTTTGATPLSSAESEELSVGQLAAIKEAAAHAANAQKSAVEDALFQIQAAKTLGEEAKKAAIRDAIAQTRSEKILAQNIQDHISRNAQAQADALRAQITKAQKKLNAGRNKLIGSSGKGASATSPQFLNEVSQVQTLSGPVAGPEPLPAQIDIPVSKAVIPEITIRSPDVTVLQARVPPAPKRNKFTSSLNDQINLAGKSGLVGPVNQLQAIPLNVAQLATLQQILGGQIQISQIDSGVPLQLAQLRAQQGPGVPAAVSQTNPVQLAVPGGSLQLLRSQSTTGNRLGLTEEALRAIRSRATAASTGAQLALGGESLQLLRSRPVSIQSQLAPTVGAIQLSGVKRIPTGAQLALTQGPLQVLRPRPVSIQSQLAPTVGNVQLREIKQIPTGAQLAHVQGPLQLLRSKLVSALTGSPHQLSAVKQIPTGAQLALTGGPLQVPVGETVSTGATLALIGNSLQSKGLQRIPTGAQLAPVKGQTLLSSLRIIALPLRRPVSFAEALLNFPIFGSRIPFAADYGINAAYRAGDQAIQYI